MSRKEYDINKATYEKSAEVLRAKYDEKGPRTENIEQVLSLINKKNAKVVELGCGYGRETAVILEKTDDYVGVDISASFIEIARRENPDANYVVSNMVDFDWPQGVDAVFAFASMLHIDKDDFRKVLENAHSSMSEDGIIFMTLKHSDAYKEEIEDADFGKRAFFYYSPEIVQNLVGDMFEDEQHYTYEFTRGTWFVQILRKK